MVSEKLKYDLIALADTMRAMGNADMGDLSYAQAALFHVAVEAIERLLDSIYDDMAKN